MPASVRSLGPTPPRPKEFPVNPRLAAAFAACMFLTSTAIGEEPTKKTVKAGDGLSIKDLFALDQRKAFEEAGVPVRCINSSGGFPFDTPTAVETNKEFNEKLHGVLTGLEKK
jgi:hypothetical protein